MVLLHCIYITTDYFHKLIAKHTVHTTSKKKQQICIESIGVTIIQQQMKSDDKTTK